MVVGWEHGVLRDFSGEKTTGKRHPGDDGYPLFPAAGKEEFCRSLPEDVEDNLHAAHPGVLYGFQSFFYLLHADAVVADFPLGNQFVKGGEHFGR
jgi:hypothetical protein